MNTPDAKLPEPAYTKAWSDGAYIDANLYTDDQMRAYGNARAREAIRTAAGWRPMESAPRDGARVLLLAKGAAYIGSARPPSFGWSIEGYPGCVIFDTTAQGWLPLSILPPPPSSAPDTREDSNEN